MQNVLPPQAGLVVNGMFYQYTIDKDIEDPASVTVRNKIANTDEYLFQETDNWSDLPGNTIAKLLNFNDIQRELWGDGEIYVEGDATITNPTVAYNYKYDTCYIVLSDPSCPGYAEALYKWLLDNGLLNGEIDINDPYYDEYVQMLLNQKTDIEQENDMIDVEEDTENSSSLQASLSSTGVITKIADANNQAAMFAALQNAVPAFVNYYTSMPGGIYEDKVSLEDTYIADNTRALRNLSQQTLHRDLVQLQYQRD